MRMDAVCEVLNPVKTPGDEQTPRSGLSTKVRLMLNDFSMKGAGVFSSIALVAGQEVQLILPEPRKMILPGKVIWCQEHNLNSHIISQELFAFRAGIEFVLTSPEQSSSLQSLLEEIQTQILGQK